MMKEEYSLKETFEQFIVEFKELEVSGSTIRLCALESNSACNVAQALRQDAADARGHGRASA